MLVLCLGNTDRGDDGFGPAVGCALEGRLPEGVVLCTRRGDMLSLIEDWKGFDALVCVDAAAPAGAPGRSCRIDLARQDLSRDLVPVSSHAFGLNEAVALARTLGLAPKSIVVYAVEGHCFESGAPMTRVVAAAVAPTARLVAAEVNRLRETTGHA